MTCKRVAGKDFSVLFIRVQQSLLPYGERHCIFPPTTTENRFSLSLSRRRVDMLIIITYIHSQQPFSFYYL